MKAILTFMFMCVCIQLNAQDNSSPRWILDPKTSPTINMEGAYVELPQKENAPQSYGPPRRVQVNSQSYFVSPNFRVHPRTTGTQSETPLTRHPYNAFVLYGSANTYQGGGLSTGTYLSVNGGHTWKGNDTLLRAGNIPIMNGGDPAPVINVAGNYMISYLTNILRMGVSYSSNGGTTFSNTLILPGSSPSTDKNMSTSDGDPASPYRGRMYTVYTEFSGANLYRIMSSYSTNNGVTWSPVVPVSPFPAGGYFNLGCDIKTGPGGVVYVVWAYSILNGQNSTEDWLGFARSDNGGASYSYTTNFAVDINGIRTASLVNGIRSNGFPRIDVDMTNCNTRGNIYVTTSEKYFLPADGVADIVLNTSTDQGNTWSRTKVNQNTDPNNYEYLAAICVDETGDINVCYYSTRNSFSNTDVEVYLSRSTDAGTTFNDILVSDHSFMPAPITGLAPGYQGDYIGITSGNGLVWPFWCENGIVNRYQAWSANVNITGVIKCEKSFPNRDLLAWADFRYYWPPRHIYIYDLEAVFPESGPPDPTYYWSRSNASAYGVDSGSGKFNSFIAPAGVMQPMETFEFAAAASNTHLVFDYAYAPNSSTELGPDSLVISYSSDGGIIFNLLEQLFGHVNGGTLNTAPATSSDFTPLPSQWKRKFYAVPPGTNKIRLRPVSGNGNSIYVDNIMVLELDPPVSGIVRVIPEGYFDYAGYLRNSDTVRVYLHYANSPGTPVDSSVGIVDQFNFTVPVFFNNAISDNYYVQVMHRNSLETWSKAGGETYVRGQPLILDMVTDSANVYGGNEKRLTIFPDRFAMFGGDVNRDGTIDGSDTQLIDNDAAQFLSGYVQTDVTGDYFVDGADALIADNNAYNFVSVIRP